jgi:nucleoside-diphosphate-sugar epimerase
VRRALVTGADGFIGRAVTARLRADGVEVVGVDLRANDEAGTVAGDVSAPGEWQRAAAGCDAVIHTAAIVGMPTDVSRFWPVNVRGTRLALEAARDNGVGRFVHLSSVVTFDLDFPDGVDERHPVRPTGAAYTDTKIASEQVALMAHASGEQEAVVVRPGDVYGPGSRPWVVLPLELMRTRRFVLPANGRGIFSPVYVDDLVDGIVRAATTPAAAGRVITLSGGVGFEARDYFGRLGAIAGMRVPGAPTVALLAAATGLDGLARLRGATNELTRDGVRYLADRRGTYSIAAARDLLDWEPRIDLDEGIARTETWLRAEGLIDG